MIGAPGAYAGKGYWTADDTAIPSDMRAYHLFIDGVNPVWGQNGTDNKKIMELTHDGLELCLGWGERSDHEVCHNITVTPSAFNATYDTGVFVLPSANQSDLGMDLHTKYQRVGVGIGLGNGHFDIDKLYQDVITVHVCVDHYHFKRGTDKFYECWNAVS
jgi:hypothetical protein